MNSLLGIVKKSQKIKLQITENTSEKDLVTLAQCHNPLEVGEVIVRSTFDGPLIKVNLILLYCLPMLSISAH